MGNLQDRLKQLALITSIALLGTATMAQDVRITTFKGDSEFTLNGRTFTITRNQDTTAMLTGDFALTSRACPRRHASVDACWSYCSFPSHLRLTFKGAYI